MPRLRNLHFQLCRLKDIVKKFAPPEKFYLNGAGREIKFCSDFLDAVIVIIT